MPLMTEEARTICNLCPLDTNSPYLDWEKHFLMFLFLVLFFGGGLGGGGGGCIIWFSRDVWIYINF